MNSKICILIGLGIAFVCCPISQSQESSPAPYVAISELVVQDANGRILNMQQLKGKRSLLVTFFPRCFTGNCTSQLTSLRDSYPALKKAGVEVWAISTDTADGPYGQRAFAKSLNLPFPLIPDPSRKLCLQFGAVQSPVQTAARMSLLIGMNGQIKWVDKQINPRTHGRDVVDKLKLKS